MSFTCKGICQRNKALKPTKGRGRYVIGQKRCQICGIYLNWKGLWCPCCGSRLRTKPRNRIFKLKFRERTNQKYQIKIINENFRNL